MTRPLVHQQFVPFQQADLELDVAVVGAGVGGAYTAWRLKEKFRDQRIALFEYSNRVGGRLYTVELPGMPHVHAEVGGMRFIPKTQAFVTDLIEHLGLARRPFPMGAPDDPAGMNNFAYLRRRQMRIRDFKDPARVPYLMNPTEQGMTPDELQQYVMNSLVPSAGKLTADQWNEVSVLNGEKLYTLGFWNLLYRALSSEAYQFMDDAGGYYTNVANTNAVLSLPVSDFGPSVAYETLVDGYEALPKALAARFTSLDGEFLPNHRLDSIAKVDGRYALLFVRTETSPSGKTTDMPDHPQVRVFARKVVLALPRRSIELVRWDVLDQPEVARLIGAVISQTAFKLFLAYPYPWWKTLGVEFGRSITDMPLRQTFYFQTEGLQPGADPANLNSLMMVSYNDLGSVPFWKALEEGDPFPGRRNPFAPAHKEVPPHEFDVTSQMVEAAQQQVREIHGLRFVPDPYSAVYHDWSDDPYGAGWHAWKAGFKFWELMKRVRQPSPKEDVYICGEAYSINQGWVEGALQTADLVLQEHFGMKPPKWLTPGYNFGY
ncbi:MAG TPA: FAD-dependent oxidoreductase [Gemmatimonadaceae bacterium]|nr:FAD-dependent oxidoreductase [Gemmatimonadaceae bacterium]